MPIRIHDDLGRELILHRPPRRIVSLVPSDTLTLFDLGAGDRVVGRTRYCVEPAGRVDAIPTCGGTKDTDVDAVLALAPDLIIANQEENARAPMERLARGGAAVLVSFPRRVGDGIAHMARLARLLGLERDAAARGLIRRGYQAVREAEDAVRGRRRLRVFVPIWLEPLMTFTGDTFASDLLALAGADNVFADRPRRYPLAADLGQRPPAPDDGRDTRYPRLTLAELAERAPDAVLLPDEPHPFGDAEVALFAAQPIPAATRGAIRLCDGKDLFWYGSRAITALPRVRALVDSLRLEA